MPSSSLFLSVGTILSALSNTAVATQYSQSESYTGKNWLEAFKFETYDLNNGFVNYVTEGVAKSSSLYRVEGDDVVFGVDGTETLDYKKGPGRKSVRLEGTKNYNHGLFVLDVKAMPGVCGMWPAFWSLGKEPWPVKGEIDIIEGVNDNKVNKYVLHTDVNCKVNGLGQTGTQAGTDCALNGPNGASGCDVNEGRTNSFGPGFNANQGGHYVMEWDSDAIKTWFFPRGTAPSNIGSANVDTSTFGTPAANFKGDCNIDERFKDQRFIFTNNFCGDWAGNAYAASGCPMGKDASGNALSPMESCKKYVAENPAVFANQFWKISSFKTYSKKSVSSSASSSMSRTSSRLSSSTKVSSSASSTKVSSSASSTKVSSSASSTKVSSSAHVTSSASHASSSSVHVSSSSSVHASVSSHVSSVVQSSSSVHVSVSSQVSSDVHSSSSVPHVVSTPSASLSSDIHSSTPVSHVSSSSEAHSSSVYYPPGQSSSSVYYPPGQSSSAVYPSSSAPVYPGGSSSSSSVSVHYYGNFSAPVSYSVPVYNGDAYSTPVPPKSTPCTTSSAKGASSTPGYPVYPNSVPAYGDYPSYPVSSPVKNDYPYLPEFTPLTPIYPPTTSKPVYNDYNQPPVSKTTVTTTYTTTYVDVCESGYITKTTTFAVTYCPTTTPAVPTPGKPNNPPTYGWDVTTKVCQYGCGEGPKTVTVTVPCTKCDLSKSTPTPAVPNKPTCNGYDCKDKEVTITTKVYSTKIITLTKTPVPEQPKSQPPVYGDKPSSKPVVPQGPKSTPPVISKPVVPEGPKSTPVVSKPAVPSVPVVSKPAVPSVPVYGNKNGTVPSISIGTGIKPTPSKTGYAPPVFTGAAASVQAGGVAAALGLAAAFFL